MALKIYNSLSRRKELFTPLHEGKITMYVCGMTVYSDAHIGHARTYLAFDIIRRYFEYKGFAVTYIQNITDVDDKIIAAANGKNIDALEFSEHFAARCFADLDALGIQPADHYPKASKTIPDMITMIQQIIDNGFGYNTNGDVYFSVERFKEYGKLSGQNLEEMKIGARVTPGDRKHNPLDFALWKAAKPGEPAWDSPWGKGRPGWHIECSTMSSKYLGLPFDIHGGGMDLRFPHHENEIAQAEAATGKLFAKHWMHVGLLTVNGEKMSKSLGNITNINDALKRWDGEVLRAFFAQTHYRSPPDFNEHSLENTKKGLDRIYRMKENFESYIKDQSFIELNKSILSAEEKEYLSTIRQFQERFETAMDDDFNTPKAFAEIFDFVNKSNIFLESVTKPQTALIHSALSTLSSLGNILTLFQVKKETKDDTETIHKLQILIKKYDSSARETAIDKLLQKLLAIREEARKQKDWKKADTIRNALATLGYELQDTENGPIWRKM